MQRAGLLFHLTKTARQQSKEGSQTSQVLQVTPETTLYQRNWAYISEPLQDALASTTLLFAGTGLGSVVARTAVQTGFLRFILADGDTVEESNLNRQAFTGAQLGQNKALAIADTVWSIAPTAKVEALPKYLTITDFPDLVRRSDLIINTIDLDDPAFLALSRETRIQGKTTLFPINIGWGGCLLVFAPLGMSLDEYVSDESPGADNSAEALVTRLVGRIVMTLPGGLPAELLPVLARFKDRTPQSWPYDPQLGIAAHLTAALTVRAAVALVAGQPVRTAPEVIWTDASTAVFRPLTSGHIADHPDDSPHVSPHVNNGTNSIGGLNGSHGDKGTPGLNGANHRHGVTSTIASHLSMTSVPMEYLDIQSEGPSATTAGFAVHSSSTSTTLAHMPIAALTSSTPRRGSPAERRDVRIFTRPGTGLVGITAPHSALTEAERCAIGRYRLEQYIAAGLYHADIASNTAIHTDPSMALLNPDDVHFTVCTENGTIVSYLCLQKASFHLYQTSHHAAQRTLQGTAKGTVRSESTPSQEELPLDLYPVMSRLNRPLFPVETEYGSLFARHQGFLDMPIGAVREITRLVRSQSTDPQVLSQLRPVAGLAIAETILMTTRYLTDPANRIEAVIGCGAPEARKTLDHFGIAVAYAPSAPILGDNLSGASQDGTLLWTDQSHAEGRFWPNAISCQDLYAETGIFHRLEEALNSESTGAASEALRAVRQSISSHRRPRYAGFQDHGEAETYGVITWTDHTGKAV